MKKLIHPTTGVLRGTYRSDKDDKVVGITMKDLREIDTLVRAGLKLQAKLLDFALSASAENPAHIGSYRNKAVELLEKIGIEPRDEGTFYTNPHAALRDAEVLLP